jgi:hypothetical protein
VNFGDALQAVKDGKAAYRPVWKEIPRFGDELFAAETTAGGSTFRQLLIRYADGSVKAFAGANWDLLAEDWEIAETAG